jgi:tRNA(Ile)-lysidine synthase
VSTESPGSLRDAVKWSIVSDELIRRDGLVLTAVSGGADSMAMLSILHGLSGELKFRVAVGHFDHKLRAESANERRLVEEFTASLSLPFHSAEEDVRALSESTGDSLEESARKARYRFLNGVAARIRADHIATGHTRNDHIETVLMRIIRGTGIRGLAGIPRRRGKLIRPLLSTGRADTLSYCLAEGIPFAKDPSNEDRRHFRNRIRLDLLPLLSTDYHPAVEVNLGRLARNAETVIASIRTVTDPIIEKNLKEPLAGQWILDTREIGGLDDTSIVVLFGDLFGEKLSCDMDFTRTHYEQLVRLVRDARASGRALSLPGVTVKKEYENLVISRTGGPAPSDSPGGHRTILPLPGEAKSAGVEIRTEIVDRSTVDDATLASSAGHACFDRDCLVPPLTLRNPVPGDRMQPFGMNGTKKLSDIFTDKKIPVRKRATSLVITDANDILWLVGVTTSEKSRVGSGTREIVRILVEKE